MMQIFVIGGISYFLFGCSEMEKDVDRVEESPIVVNKPRVFVKAPRERMKKKEGNPREFQLYRNIRPHPVSKDGYKALVDLLKKELIVNEPLCLKQGFFFNLFDFVEDDINAYNPESDSFGTHKFTSFNVNKTLNRYEHVKCNDKTRVFLENQINDYINATWMICDQKEYRGKNILTQGPMKNTITDFWAMIYQENVDYIVMFCSFYEKGVEQCAKYYPTKEEGVEKERYENFEVKYVRREKDPVKGVTWTILHLIDHNSNDTRPRRVNHVYVSWWPEKTAPDDAKLTIELYRWLMEKNESYIPIVFHCNNGIGRSAVFCSIYFFLRFDIQVWVKHGEEFSSILLYNTRDYRDDAIETPLQFIFLHVCLLEYFCQEGDMERSRDVEQFMREYKEYAQKIRKCVRAGKVLENDEYDVKKREKIKVRNIDLK